jgi:acyl-CoA hydrolase
MNGKVYEDVKKGVDELIKLVGKDIKIAVPHGLGKPVRLLNEIYKRAKEDPTATLWIISGLLLEKPAGNSDLENRMLGPIQERLFAGVNELDYVLDMRAGKLPKNVQLFEFYGRAGADLKNAHFQMNHLASNFSHCCRDGIGYSFNVFAQTVAAPKKIDGKTVYSMGSNTDISIEAVETLKEMRAKGITCATLAEVNANTPFMYGDAVRDKNDYDIIFQGESFNGKLFGVPKAAVTLSDHMIGLNVSSLVKDGGTIQVGIGALGDAIVSGLILRNENNQMYNDMLDKCGITEKYGDLIKKWGSTGVFKQGLYALSEMFVDAFLEMHKKGILKRKVFDSVPVMQLINKGELSADKIPIDIIDKLLKMEAIYPKLREKDFKFLTEFGILKKGLKFDKGVIKDGTTSYPVDMEKQENRTKIRKILGKELLGGKVILGAFFIGSQSFYKALNEMSEEERMLFGMSGVEKVNQLYGDEVLRELQRKNSRFVNAGMKATLLGAIASDQLEDGRVVSGIGGQYDFASMAFMMRDARFIMMIKATKGAGKRLESNIVFSYGHCSVPKHLKDIVVTEYGIADIHGKPEKDVVMELLNIADSRFQPQLLAQAKKANKIPQDYEIPKEYRNNTPDKVAKLLKPYQAQGYFKAFPFGTDFTPEEVTLGGSLRGMKNLLTGSPLKFGRGVLFELLRPIPKSAEKYLVRMGLAKPASMKEKITRKLVLFALRNNKAI